jgi:hypothetical protein
VDGSGSSAAPVQPTCRWPRFGAPNAGARRHGRLWAERPCKWLGRVRHPFTSTIGHHATPRRGLGKGSGRRAGWLPRWPPRGRADARSTGCRTSPVVSNDGGRSFVNRSSGRPFKSASTSDCACFSPGGRLSQTYLVCPRQGRITEHARRWVRMSSTAPVRLRCKRQVIESRNNLSSIEQPPGGQVQGGEHVHHPGRAGNAG